MVVGIDVSKELKRLSQEKNLKYLTEIPSMTEFLTVHLTERKDSHLRYTDCALIPNELVEDCLSKATYDLHSGSGKPGAIRYYEKNKTERVEYFRFGTDDGFEPLVIMREFHNLHEPYLEISEEFRLFHDLYHEKSTNKFYKIKSDGSEDLVAIVEEHCVKIRLKEIRQFLAIKEMHLSIQFDWREHSPNTLEELGLKGTIPDDSRDNLTFCGMNYGDIGMSGCRAFSRLLGKTMIKPLPKEKCGLWGFAEEEEKQYSDFIISVTDNGDNVLCSANPAEASKHPLKPDYLTRVDFKRSVLDRYYQQPSKYGVEDGYLRCGTLWGLFIDNHHADKVSAWLGDLGRDLPYSEQLHWKLHNIPPVGGPSSTFFRRQILAQFTNSDRKEHLFVFAYENLAKVSEQQLGWSFYKKLSSKDQHHLRSLRVPASNEQKEFDELILSLSKLLIDYLNESKLKIFIDKNNPDEVKPGISLLERILDDLNITDDIDHIEFLRNLQKIRSKGSAHQKGKEYTKLLKELNPTSDLSQFFESLLGQGIDFLEYIQEKIIAGTFSLKE